MLALSLGDDPSEFRCLPEELVERLDQHPDAIRQIDDISRWYARRARHREDQRLLDLAPRAMGGDKGAVADLDAIVRPRAEREGVGPNEYITQFLAKHGRQQSHRPGEPGSLGAGSGAPTGGARISGRAGPNAP